MKISKTIKIISHVKGIDIKEIKLMEPEFTLSVHEILRQKLKTNIPLFVFCNRNTRVDIDKTFSENNLNLSNPEEEIVLTIMKAFIPITLTKPVLTDKQKRKLLKRQKSILESKNLLKDEK